MIGVKVVVAEVALACKTPALGSFDLWHSVTLSNHAFAYKYEHIRHCLWVGSSALI